ncbi:MAG: helix-turn-helix domain-containing protein [Candidatus Asgardarchaeia archaeon]
MNVAELVRSQRISKGWTLKDLFKISGVHPDVILRTEKGEIIPSIHKAFHIAQAMGIDPPSFCQSIIIEWSKRFAKENVLFYKDYKKKGDFSKNPYNCIFFSTSNSRGKVSLKLKKTGRYIHNRRVEQSLTIINFLKIMGMERRELLSIEAGRKSLPLKKIFAISKCLKINPYDLFHMQLLEKIKCYVAHAEKKVAEYMEYYREKQDDKDEVIKLIKSYHRDNVSCPHTVFLRDEEFQSDFSVFYLEAIRGLTYGEQSKLIGVHPHLIRSICLSWNLPGQMMIYRLCNSLFLNLEPIYEMVLSDRVRWYDYKHRIVFDKYKKGELKDNRGWAFRFDEGTSKGIGWNFKKTSAYIKNKRTSIGKSQLSLCKEVNVSVSNVARSEGGSYTPTPLLILGLAKLANFDPDELFEIMLSEKIDHLSANYRNRYKKLLEEMDR